jgi:hypothetical protein
VNNEICASEELDVSLVTGVMKDRAR